MRGEETGDDSERPISHGICDRCLTAQLLELSEPLPAFLDRLRAPVLVVDDDVGVLTANASACLLLGRSRESMRGYRGGDLIECVHARKPGGCGLQACCASCTIRRSVTETHETGAPVVGRPAFPDVQQGQQTVTVTMRISTEKAGDCVLLRIDEIGPAPET